MRGRKSPLAISLTPEEKAELEAVLRRTTAKAGLAHRARIIVLLAGTHNIALTAREVEDRRRIVRKWGWRYHKDRLKGLMDAPRTGRPPVFSPRGRGVPREAGVRDAGHERDAGVAVGLLGIGEEARR